MQHLNYCRQALAAGIRGDAGWKEDWQSGYGESFEDTVRSSHKFILPDDGKIIEDDEFRGILSVGFVSAPYEKTILEFKILTDDGPPLKCVLFLRQYEENNIHVVALFYIQASKMWMITPSFGITVNEGAVSKRISSQLRTWIDNPAYGKDVDHIVSVFSTAACDFLNAISCRNVHVEKSPAKASKQGKKVKTALPFDDYHFLTVDVPGKAGVRGEGLGGSHRSPREHLRRGHIRRLESGPIWVNACVVNAGIGSKVGKSYLVRRAQ